MAKPAIDVFLARNRQILKNRQIFIEITNQTFKNAKKLKKLLKFQKSPKFRLLAKSTDNVLLLEKNHYPAESSSEKTHLFKA